MRCEEYARPDSPIARAATQRREGEVDAAAAGVDTRFRFCVAPLLPSVVVFGSQVRQDPLNTMEAARPEL
jgi:hypothetical protein